MIDKSYDDIQNLIEQLHYYQQNLNESNAAEFKTWQKKVAEKLDWGLRVRFLKLDFFYEEPDDQIPF